MSLTSFADLKKIIPNEWDLVSNRALYKEIKLRNGSADSELLSVTQDKGLIKQSDNTEKKDISNEDKSNYKLVNPGNLVYNKMRMWQGAVGLSKYSGVVSPAYVVLDVNRVADPKFLFNQMKTSEYIAQSYSYSYGLCDDMNSLRYEDFRNMLSILPPLTEQHRIVTFLDRKRAFIDTFIANKQQYIEKLLENKQAVINNAVTKGLDSDVPTEQTSNWLSESPKQWCVKKLKYLSKLRNGSALKDSSTCNKIALENIESFTGKLIETEETFEGPGNYFTKGDVLFGKLRPYLGKVHISETDGICVSDILVISPNTNEVTRSFIFYRLLSRDFIAEVNSSTYGTKMPRANWQFIGNLKIPVPEIDEQKRIVNYIEQEIATIDMAISKARQQIDLIKEYRESLITHAVIGQIKIKE